MIESLAFSIWKAKALTVGFFYYKKLMRSKNYQKAMRGVCCPNGTGDLSLARKFGAQYYRFNHVKSQQIESSSELNGPYFLLMDGRSDDDVDLANRIKTVFSNLKVAPSYILCQNENNEISYQLPQKIRKILSEEDPPFPHNRIVKGPFTCVVESAAKKKYFRILTNRDPCDWSIYGEFFNYYEKAHWEKNKLYKLENLKRRCMFTYIVMGLKKRGIKEFHITEAHDGEVSKVIVISLSEWRPLRIIDGRMDGDEFLKRIGSSVIVRRHELDFVFASKEGFESILDFCSRLGVKSVSYYQAPYLGYTGNTMLKGKQ